MGFDIRHRLEDIGTSARAKYSAVVTAVMALSFWVRFRPESGIEYLQALDPYMLFTASRHFALEGSLPVADYLRYFPYNMPVYELYTADLVIPGLLYNIGPQFFFSYLQWAQIYPALMGALSVGAMYLFAAEFKNRVAGVASAFFLATVPAALTRTSAGFFEKEPTAMVFIVLCLYGFTAAWKRRDWRFGMLSGISLGLASAAWGGAQMVWLLLPLTIGSVLPFSTDIKSLVRSYTPTVILGAVIAFSMSSGDYSPLDQIFFANYVLLSLVWMRYLVEKKGIIEDRLQWFVPSVYFVGIFAALASPLYSNFVARRVVSVVALATQSTGGVIAGTVAENQASSAAQFVSQLTSSSAGSLQILPSQIASVASPVGLGTGPLTLAYLSVSVFSTYTIFILLNRVGYIGSTVSEKALYKVFAVATAVWTVAFSLSFQNPIAVVSLPIILLAAGSLFLYYFDELESNIEIRVRWYYVLGLFFIIANIIGAATKSRLIFLSSYPVAFGAGLMVSQAWKRYKMLSDRSLEILSVVSAATVLDLLVVVVGSASGFRITLTVLGAAVLNAGIWKAYTDNMLSEATELLKHNKAAIPAAVSALLIVSTGVSAAVATSDSVSGSPNSFWIENMNYLEQEVEPDEVVLSWWDYGYWFGNLGGRASVADGGNFGYYSSGDKVNKPLADFLTGENISQHRSFLAKHSVDYVTLDSSMIGKYSAVSQISNGDNSVYGRLAPVRTRSFSLQDSSSNRLVVSVRGRVFDVNAPVETGGGSVEVSSPPSLKYGLGRSTGRGKVDCLINSDGEKSFEVDESERLEIPQRLSSALFGPEFGSESVEVCLAERPTRPLQSVLADRAPGFVVVPKAAKDDVLVELYLGDGAELPRFKKLDEGSNRFVKMWQYKPNATAQ